MKYRFLVSLILVLVLVMVLSAMGAEQKTAYQASPIMQVGKDFPQITPVEKAPALTTLYVNSRSGDDRSGTGAEILPFKTLTHALNVARSGTTIIAEPGTEYTAETGEVFPIQMKSGVTLKKRVIKSTGLSVPISPNPVIRGGARYDIPDSPLGRYVAVLGADNAEISGFSFQLVNSPGHTGTGDGTGILCDGTSPVIRNNQFSGNGHAGITLLGTAHPQITDNTFTGNVNWGITAYGESYPTVSGNSFSTKNGMDCTDRSHPTIDRNTFSTGGTGISTKGWAQAVISNNVIKGNNGYGIMVRMDSTPVVQGNTITQNPIGVMIAPGEGSVPDLGGGGRSTGGNTFDNYDWDIEHRGYTDISAKNNNWKSACCEDIAVKIYDRNDDTLSGSVDVGTCMICRMMAPGLPGRS